MFTLGSHAIRSAKPARSAGLAVHGQRSRGIRDAPGAGGPRHTNRAPQTSTSASTPVQQLPHCTLHRKYHALRNRSPFLPRLIQEPLRRRDPTSLIAQPGDYEAIPATIPSHVPQSRESYSIVSVSHSFPHIRSQDGTCFIKVTSKIQRVGNGSIINALQLSAWILHSAWVAFVSADAVQWAVLRVGT